MYLNIYKARVPFENLFGNIHQLDKDYKLGDVIDLNGVKYILADTGNPILLEERNDFVDSRFKCGSYVQLINLNLVDIMESDVYLEIDGFCCQPETTRFYSLIGFDSNMNEITDKTKHKDRTLYRYYRTRDL